MRRSLLIVEDDTEGMAILKRWFIRAGYQVTGVHHPRQALAASALRPFEVVIISYILPELDGVELMQRLKRVLGNIQVILLAYDPQAVSDLESEAAGAFACLTKPYELLLLAATVQEAFDHAATKLPVCGERNVPVITYL